MKLITKELLKQIPNLYEGDTPIEEKIVYAHYFIPLLNWDWWACEYDPETKEFFGYANLNNSQMAEWGYFSLTEFEAISQAYPQCPVERELNFKPQKILEIQHPSLEGLQR